MAQPTVYNRITSFTTDQAVAPTTPLAGASFDAEFNALKTTLDQVLANVALIQRDDGQVANKTIGFDQLKNELVTGFQTPTAWLTGTIYAVGVPVFVNGIFYKALIAHTSGVFATDLAAGKWALVADFAAVLAGVLHGTSATSLTIGTGSKTFATQAGVALPVGAPATLASTVAPANYMAGIVTASAAGAVTFNVLITNGAGTIADWQVSATGPQGAVGPIGPAGIPGFLFDFQTAITDTDPGDGKFRFNNATISAATRLYIDTVDVSLNNVSNWLDFFDDVGGASRGVIYAQSVDHSAFAAFQVTDNTTVVSGYRKIVVVPLVVVGTFADGQRFGLSFSPAGNPTVRDYVNVRDKNAQGDSNGTPGNGTDDTAAFQAAFDEAAPLGKSVWVPPGCYRLTAPITGNIVNGFYHLRGVRYASKIFNDAASAGHTLSFSPASLGAVALLPLVSIRGLNFIAPSHIGVGFAHVRANNCQAFDFQENWASGHQNGLILTNCFGPSVVGNNLTGFASCAIYSSDASFNVGRITHNGIYGNGLGTSDAAVSIAGTTGGLVVDNNDVEANYAGFLFAGNHSAVQLSANVIETSTSFSAYWTGTNVGWNIFANFFGSGLTTTWAGVTKSRIRGNNFSDTISLDATCVNNDVGGNDGAGAPSEQTTFGGFVVSKSPTGGLGYATGAGGTVTQATSKSTAVTLNKVTGLVTLNAAALAAATIVSFTLNDTAIAATDQIIVTHESGGTLGAYGVNGRATGAGTGEVNVRNNTAGSLSEAIVLRVSVLKSVNA